MPRPRERTVGRANVEVGSDPIEERRFAQERLALFAKLLLGLTTGGYFMTFLVTYGGWPDDPRVFRSVTSLAFVGAALVFLVVWLIARGATLRRAALTALDLGGVVTAAVLLGFMAATIPIEIRPDLVSRHLVGLLVTTNLLVARAVLVPSHPYFTLGVGLLAAAPAVFIAATVDGPGVAQARTAYSLTWTFIALVTSTIVSRVIYGLRKRVREASKMGRYTLGERIGRGGMGTVYRAEHAMLRRPTALKLLDANEVGERGLARFEREVQVTARLTHPSTIQIFDYGRTGDGIFYYAMELVDGLDLHQLVQRHGPQEPARVVEIARQACGSLGEAHRQRLVHRDVKPENLILTHRPGQGDVLKVFDFGLVKDTGSEDTLSVSGTVLGTPQFMSPENLTAPDLVGPTSDIYALGGVMYFLLTGEHVFERTSITEMFSAHVHDTPVRPSVRSGLDIPHALEELVMTCLSKEPSDRPNSAEALAEALRATSTRAWTPGDALRWWSGHEAR